LHVLQLSSFDVVDAEALQGSEDWLLGGKFSILDVCKILDLVSCVQTVHVGTLYIWPFLGVSDLSKLEGEDDPESDGQHDCHDQKGTKNSSTVVDSLDVSVLPDDVGGLSSLLELCWSTWFQ
jgi:hypothetical protein